MKKIAPIILCLLLITSCKTSAPNNNTNNELGYYVQETFDRDLRSMDLCDGCLPSVGQPKMLVIAVDFPNIPAQENHFALGDIENVFNGTSASTGWESVHSFYYKSSYGKLDIDIQVYGWYRAKNPTGYYKNLGSTDGSSLLVKEALTYYDEQIDYSQFDSNGDEYIDSVYIVYSRNTENFDSIWWGFQSYYVEYDYFDEVTPYYYAFSSREFMTFDSNLVVDAHVFIHETGHLLGLDDYYDYDTSVGPPNGLGCADMMDDTIGDHNPFSKLILGWTQPIIIDTDKEITIDFEAFADTGQTMILANDWTGDMFSEYFILQYYTPTKLQAYDQVFSQSGIIVYHVIANVIGKGESQTFKYNNSYTEKKIISIIEADGGSNSELVANSDLFRLNDYFNEDGSIQYSNSSSLKYSFLIEAISATTISMKIQLVD